MSKGLFITLEGSDGAGKTTQIANIENYFRKKGREVVLSREPGGTAIGEKLRAILLDKANGEMDGVAEMLIYAAARAQHVAEKIKPALERGAVVICDRFVDSSVAYQGFGRGLGEQVRKVNAYATGGLAPDVTFFLDLDPEAARRRRDGMEDDRLESEKMAFHRKVYDGYRTLSAEEPQRVICIDASRGIEEIREDLYAHLAAMENGER